MTSPNISSQNKKAGFTLIEIVIAIAILTAMLALGLFMSMDSYRAYLSRSERDTVVSLLQRARSHAMANSYNTTWGLCYISPNYIIFRGSTCTAGAATNEATPANTGAVITGLSSAPWVVFSQVAGTTTAATITVTENTKVSTITINNEGTINW
jgi:prepilin-type N-terminal cleavage/methylation domain-containing protein